jgi:hypothetical protein
MTWIPLVTVRMSSQDMDTPGYSKNESTGHGYPLVTVRMSSQDMDTPGYSKNEFTEHGYLWTHSYCNQGYPCPVNSFLL